MAKHDCARKVFNFRKWTWQKNYTKFSLVFVMLLQTMLPVPRTCQSYQQNSLMDHQHLEHSIFSSFAKLNYYFSSFQLCIEEQYLLGCDAIMFGRNILVCYRKTTCSISRQNSCQENKERYRTMDREDTPLWRLFWSSPCVVPLSAVGPGERTQLWKWELFWACLFFDPLSPIEHLETGNT